MTATPRRGVLHLGIGDAAPTAPELAARADALDLYDLAPHHLDGRTGVHLAMGVDQLHLARTPLLEEFVRAGGRVVLGGHVLRPFLTGLPRWRRLDFRGPEDLRIIPVTSHPIWDGVDFDELLYRTGMPGPAPTGERLAALGVAGFYGRGYHGHLPEGATVLNAIGPHRLPLDLRFPLGAGEVLAHAGNDLISFADPRRSTRQLGARLLDWLEGK